LIETGPLTSAAAIDSPTQAIVQAPPKLGDDGGKRPLRGCRLLLAEDGPDNRHLVELLLKREGAEVASVENGLLACEAVAAARDAGTPFDLILMDMQMPVMDGYAATRALRESGYGGGIVALAAHANAGAEGDCRQAGCDDYVSKPIVRQKLIAAIRRHRGAAAAHDGQDATSSARPKVHHS
jgi:CheY-like chemotaxis protein